MTRDGTIGVHLDAAHHNHWNANDSYKYKMNANTNAMVKNYHSKTNVDERLRE